MKASFTRGDFAFDWVKRYLEDHHIWDHSRVYQVSACNPVHRGLVSSTGSSGINLEEHTDADGHPQPVYQPAPKEPELFRWRNYWITVGMGLESGAGYEKDAVQVLTLRC